MIKTNGIIFFLLVLVAGTSFAMGNKDEDFQPVNGLSDWSSKIELDEGADGRHNVIVRAKDKAGNVTYDGPYNIRVDADSDLPIISIVSPAPNSRVGGDLNVVGACSDDDGISKIMIMVDDGPFVEVEGGEYWYYYLDVSELADGLHMLSVKAYDTNGLEGPTVEVPFHLDIKKPVINVAGPEAGLAVNRSVTVGGSVKDGNLVETLEYSIDFGKSYKKVKLEKPLETGDQAFSFSINLKKIANGQLDILLKAVDQQGSVGYHRHWVVVEGGFEASALEDDKSSGLSGDLVEAIENIAKEPDARIVSPLPGVLINQVVLLKGVSSGNNGIEQVLISFDSGVSYDRVMGTDEWQYRFDSTLFEDGIYPIWVEPIDKLGVKGFYSSLIIIDNTAPEINFLMPDTTVIQSENMTVSAFCRDDGQMKSIKYTVSSAASGKVVLNGEMPLDEFVKNEFAIAALSNGEYIVRIYAEDVAGNIEVSKKVVLVRNNQQVTAPTIIFPEQGAQLSGIFTIEGSVAFEGDYKTVSARVMGDVLGTAEINDRGYYKIEIDPEKLSNGKQDIIISLGAEGSDFKSSTREIYYQKEGPWLKVDNFTVNDYVKENFFIRGSAGFYQTQKKIVAEAEEGGDGALVVQEDMGTSVSVRIKKVEVSLDNGQNFNSAKGRDDWKFKIRTPSLPDGRINLLVRLTLRNGETAIVKQMLLLDQTPPVIKMKEIEGVKINSMLAVEGSASDANGLESVEIALREGSKYQYEPPDALKGLYIAISGLGASTYNVGLGLSLFDDNVRLQFQAGESPAFIEGEDGVLSPSRFYGIEMGAKFLARLYELKFGDYLGSDADFFSMSWYLGTGVSYFTMTDGIPAAEDETQGVFLGAILGQYELNFDFDEIPMFSNYSIYGEFSLWFISSDVQSEVIPSGSVGIKIGIF